VDGAWLAKTAESYQQGHWNSWIYYLYSYGTFYNGQSLEKVANSGGSHTFNADCVNINVGTVKQNYYYMRFAEPVDMTDKTKVIVRAKSKGAWTTTGTASYDFGFGVLVSKSTAVDWTDPHANRKSLTNGQEFELTVDVSSLSGNHYITIRGNCSNGSGTLNVDIYEVEVS
jgi:hypothetical protein